MRAASKGWPTTRWPPPRATTRSCRRLAPPCEAAGLTDTLNGEGPFTIFAPSNSAFGKIPPGDLDARPRRPCRCAHRHPDAARHRRPAVVHERTSSTPARSTRLGRHVDDRSVRRSSDGRRRQRSGDRRVRRHPDRQRHRAHHRLGAAPRQHGQRLRSAAKLSPSRLHSARVPGGRLGRTPRSVSCSSTYQPS